MRYFFLAGLLILSALVLAIPAPTEKIVFLDIGQGDSILLQDDTRQVLIDGGQGTTVLTRLAEELPWFDKTIDVVIATHPDRDHLEGLVHVLKRYDVGLVLLPNVAHTSQLQEEWLTRLQTEVEAQDVLYRFAHKGQTLEVGDIKLAMIGPEVDANVPSGKTNNASVITRVDMHDLSLLLTGDAERQAENQLVQRTPAQTLDVDVLKAGHHGSNTSTHEVLINAASPSVVVISVGQDNRFGHPHPDTLERLKDFQVWRTDEHGSVRFLHKNGQWFLSSQNKASEPFPD